MTGRVRPSSVLAGLLLVGAAAGHLVWCVVFVALDLPLSRLGEVHHVPMLVGVVGAALVLRSRARVPLTTLAMAVFWLPMFSRATFRALDVGCGCTGCGVSFVHVAAADAVAVVLLTVGALALPRHPVVAVLLAPVAVGVHGLAL